MLGDNSFCLEVKHHCPICYQWMASAPGLKRHMHRHHPEWSQHMPSVLQLTKVIKGDMTRPRKYCRASSFDMGRHWKQCPVVLSAAFLQCIQHTPASPVLPSNARNGPGRDGQARARTLLREAEPTARHADEGGGQYGAGEETTHGSRESEAQARQRKRERGVQRQPTLQELWGPGRANRTDPHVDEACPTSRPGHSDDQAFHVYAQTGPGSIIPILYKDASRWKAIKEQSPTELNSSLRETLMRSLLEEMRVRIRACKDQPESIEFAQKQEWVATMRASGSGHCAVYSRDLVEGARPSDPLRSMQVGQLFGPAIGGHQTAAGAAIPSIDGTGPSAQASAMIPSTPSGPQRPTRWPLLQCALQNPSNHCYMNHTLLPYLWTTLQSTHKDLQQLSPIFRQLIKTPTMALMRSIMWSHLTRAWPLPNQQHDAAEFATHLHTQAELPQFRGRWEARQLREQGIHITDCHPAILPLSLPTPDSSEPLNVGECIRH